MRTQTLLPLLAALALASPAPAADRPNIVLIISDDHGWPDYGFMGNEIVATPRIDRLAASGLCFPHGYVTTSLCSPSLATIFTGLHTHQHGITSNDPPTPKGLKPAERQKAMREIRPKLIAKIDPHPSLVGLLAKNGYLTLQTGKWWLGNPKDRGFTHTMTQGGDNPKARHGDEGLAIGRETMQPIEDFVDEAVRDKKPFFVWYAPFLPHTPHNPPERLMAKYRDSAPSLSEATYYAMVDWLDETCGQMFDYIEKKGADKNTVVAYVADNGWFPNPAKVGTNVRSKLTPYDAGLRTPILLSWPGKIAARRIDQPVSSIDLMPTLLKCAGVEPPPGLPGIDLRDEAAVLKRDAIFGAIFTHDAVDLENPAHSLAHRWCVSGGWKLIDPGPNAKTPASAELYHVAQDPRETKDLAAADPARVTSLRAKLDAWWPAK